MIGKHIFKFEPMDGLVDIYVGEYKLRNSHNGSLGQVALPLKEEYAPFVSVEPHDERIGIDIIITANGDVDHFERPAPINPKPTITMELVKES